MDTSPSSSSAASSTSRRHPAARRWNDDWDHLAASIEATVALVRWQADPLLSAPDLNTLLVAAGAGGTSDAANADDVLGRLVRRAPSDRVAARTVLQRVLPGLIAAARRRAGAEKIAIGSLLDELVATAWTVIVTYPVERRPAKFAVNIVRDSEYLAFVRARRLRHVVEELSGDALTGGRAPSCGADGRREDEVPNSSETVDVMLARAEEHGLHRDDLRLLRALYVDGRAVDEVAGEHAIGARALRYRRSAAVDRLARLSAA